MPKGKKRTMTDAISEVKNFGVWSKKIISECVSANELKDFIKELQNLITPAEERLNDLPTYSQKQVDEAVQKAVAEERAKWEALKSEEKEKVEQTD